MPKSIERRVHDSFDDHPKKALQYSEWLRTSISDYIQNMRRNAAVLLLLVAIFELVLNSRNAEISIGSFHVSKGSVVLTFIPAVVGYLYLEVVLDSQRIDQVNTAFRTAFEVWSVKARAEDLNEFMYGPQPTYWTSLLSGGRNIYRVDTINDITSIIFAIGLLVGVLLYEGQAYSALFPSHASSFITWSISLAVTLVCLAISALIFWADNDA
jgi:hypothetical protein